MVPTINSVDCIANSRSILTGRRELLVHPAHAICCARSISHPRRRPPIHLAYPCQIKQGDTVGVGHRCERGRGCGRFCNPFARTLHWPTTNFSSLLHSSDSFGIDPCPTNHQQCRQIIFHPMEDRIQCSQMAPCSCCLVCDHFILSILL